MLIILITMNHVCEYKWWNYNPVHCIGPYGLGIQLRNRLRNYILYVPITIKNKNNTKNTNTIHG